MKREMEAYIVLLHLVSQGWANFSDIRDLLGWESFRNGHAQNIIAHIDEKLPELSEKFGEDIPPINAFMFLTNSGECSAYICESVFKYDDGKQPSARQVVKYAKAIAAYPNWDKVLEEFRKEAFQS